MYHDERALEIHVCFTFFVSLLYYSYLHVQIILSAQHICSWRSNGSEAPHIHSVSKQFPLSTNLQKMYENELFKTMW
jgi:hypothetical protein